MLSGNKGRQPAAAVLKPAAAGLLVSFAVTMLLIAVFSMVFVIVKSIAESAVVPLALISAAVGCFVGAMICVTLTRCGGVAYGAAIGLVMFAAIWIIGAFGEDAVFGTETMIKFVLLTAGGIAGGCAGRRRIERKR